MMQTFVALLRGINVGGKNLVKMAELKALLTSLGLEDVRTLLQSGNVVFKASIQAEDLEKALERATAESLGVSPAYMLRSAKELRHIVSANPFADFAADDPAHLLVHFFKEPIDRSQAEEVARQIKGPERIVARDRELYVVYPDGVGRSTIAKTPGWNRLAAAGTGRNWNTVLKLDAMCDD